MAFPSLPDCPSCSAPTTEDELSQFGMCSQCKVRRFQSALPGETGEASFWVRPPPLFVDVRTLIVARSRFLGGDRRKIVFFVVDWQDGQLTAHETRCVDTYYVARRPAWLALARLPDSPSPTPTL